MIELYLINPKHDSPCGDESTLTYCPCGYCVAKVTLNPCHPPRNEQIYTICPKCATRLRIDINIHGSGVISYINLSSTESFKDGVVYMLNDDWWLRPPNETELFNGSCHSIKPKEVLQITIEENTPEEVKDYIDSNKKSEVKQQIAEKYINEVFKNASDLEFKDISSEIYRTYEFPDFQITITNPLKLNVSERGGHRIWDKDGVSHYVPPGWRHLYWLAKDDEPHFKF